MLIAILFGTFEAWVDTKIEEAADVVLSTPELFCPMTYLMLVFL